MQPSVNGSKVIHRRISRKVEDSYLAHKGENSSCIFVRSNGISKLEFFLMLPFKDYLSSKR